MRGPSRATVSPPHSRLRIRQRVVVGRAVLPAARYTATALLVASLLLGGWRFLALPTTVGALEFTPHIIGVETGAVGVQGLATGDVDGDGDHDIVTAGLDGVKLYENKGKFKFTVHILDEADAERVQITKLTDDDRLDLLVTYKGSSPSVKWYRNDGEREFKAFSLGTTGADALAYAGDLDGDGKRDIATAGTEGGAVVLRRWMGNGAETFTSTTLSSDSAVTALTVADTDRNGYRDIITGGPRGLQRWRTTNGTTFSRDDIDDSKENRTHIATADPGDGRTFIFTGDTTSNVVALYRGLEGNDYSRRQLELSADAKTVAPADLDSDGDIDVVVVAQDENLLYWYENDGTDTFTQRTLASELTNVYGAATADVDGDGDLDVITGNFDKGNVIAYERVRAKPVATKLTNIKQSAAGTGVITFEATFSDGDSDPTRARIQYSRDGIRWDKPWLTKVTADSGSVDLKNSNGYQVGTRNAIDTTNSSSVKLTFTWDTKSVENTGGPFTGDTGGVKLRVLPRDAKSLGEPLVSGAFRVDNAGPQGLGGLRVVAAGDEELELAWTKPTDSSAFTYKLYYGTDATAVLEQRSDVWDSDDDGALEDVDTTDTTVKGLTAATTYTFKLIATDAFGNTAAASSVRGTTATAGVVLPSPTPGITPSVSPTGSITPSAEPEDSPAASTSPQASATPSGAAVLQSNRAPIADAGLNQVVNPSALVILDGSASFDPDRDSWSYSWRQVAGPRVELNSARTATPSFSAGDENETYIFVLTVRDPSGATATDTITIATRALPVTTLAPVAVGTPVPAPVTSIPAAVASPLVTTLLHPSNMILFVLSCLSTLLLILDRVVRAIKQGRLNAGSRASAGARPEPHGRVVHYKTGEGIAGAQVLIYGDDGKLRATEHTNERGVFGTFFPVGQYTLGVQASGFTFAPSAPRSLAPEGGILYSGGKLAVREAGRALSIVIPMKPLAEEVSSLMVRLLHLWQTMQHVGRILSWPIFLAGALLNTTLVFIAPRPLYLVIEVLYIGLVIIKIALEVRIRPAYGQVRDAITHVPLDLAVVRLFDHTTNRLVMTRVTNNQGRFFALPPAGTYTVTIAKPGYATFAKENVELKAEQDTTLQMTADLMPIAPATGSLQQARAAVL